MTATSQWFRCLLPRTPRHCQIARLDRVVGDLWHECAAATAPPAHDEQQRSRQHRPTAAYALFGGGGGRAQSPPLDDGDGDGDGDTPEDGADGGSARVTKGAAIARKSKDPKETTTRSWRSACPSSLGTGVITVTRVDAERDVPLSLREHQVARVDRWFLTPVC